VTIMQLEKRKSFYMIKYRDADNKTTFEHWVYK
jgi:hypothetical protein